MHPASERVHNRLSALGPYRIREHLSSEGMVDVYLAELTTESGFVKPVSLKLQRPEIACDPREKWRFFDEARLASAVSHPNVCSVLDFGETDGVRYMTMEYLHGRTLGSVLKRAEMGQSVPLPLILRAVADAARGLAAVHEIRTADRGNNGVVHRDVCPQSIFVQYSGVSKLLDFGVSLASAASHASSETDELHGKLGYAAPEQIAGGKLDGRADVWALGVMLWEAVTGQRMLESSRIGETVTSILSAPIPLPSSIVSDTPKALEVIVMRALERDPAQRTESASDLAEQLEDYLDKLPTVWNAEQVSEHMSELFADEDPTLRISRLLKLHAEAESVRSSALPSTAEARSSVDIRTNGLSPNYPSVPPVLGGFSPAAERPSSMLPAWAQDMAAVPEAALDEPESIRSIGRWRQGTMLVAAAAVMLGVLGSQRSLLSSRLVPARTLQSTATSVAFAASRLTASESARQPSVASPASPTVESLVLAEPAPVKTATKGPVTVRAAAQRRPLATAPVTADKPGYLYLTTAEPVQVFANGRSLGQAPLRRAEFAPGRHVLSLVPRDGGQAKFVPVTIASHSTVIVAMR